MTDFLSQDALQVQNTKFSSMLLKNEYLNVPNEVQGRIFQETDFAKDWDSIYVHPSDLEYGKSEKGMRKLTTPTLIMASHSPMIAFVLASDEDPVFICSEHKRTQTIGYTLAFRLNPCLLPDYLFYMSKYDSWIEVSKSIDIEDEYKKVYGDFGKDSWSNVGKVFSDGIITCVTTAEKVFLDRLANSPLNIPSVIMQKQRIADAKSMEKILQEKMAEKERKFQQKEWLNEAHIRNCKHRLSNDIMPVRMAVERLEKFFINSPNGVKLYSIIGLATHQTVENLLNGLKDSIHIIENEIYNLTKSETIGQNPEIIDVEKFIKGYCKKMTSMFVRRFKTNIKVKEENLKIKIPQNAFIELLDCIISNAVRHGFTDNARFDYQIHITISRTKENFCKIDIANNGNPISERGRNEYFVRGSFSGNTGHSGIGGARVFEICDEYNGNVQKPYSIEGFPVVISVEFPITLH